MTGQPPLDLVALGSTLDALAEGLQILSPEWRYLYVNDAAARHGRRPRKELVGNTMMACYPGIETTEIFATLTACMNDRVPANLDNEFTYPDGGRGSFELRVQPCAAGIVILSIDVTERRDHERQLRHTVRALSTPVVRVYPGILLQPLVGVFDDERATELAETMLAAISEHDARVVMFDVSGVPTMDTGVARHLLATAAAVRVLGAEVILTGISAAAARSIVHLGIDLSTVKTTSRLSAGLELALSLVGKEVRAITA
ncbi:MAG: PAS domain-containing protein [Kofleriaceae bacterium]|nr:MAG: PAS domain-containing protein [Kofleriaceae bacterium]MBZ0231169.1 PAS domain-containing protein [Kofleriaceae bacterium]